jgi:hypothetical protein
MNCPHCGHDKSLVTETRARAEADLRYRICKSCAQTFTTLERVCVYAGKTAGYLEAVQSTPALAAVPDHFVDSTKKVAAVERVSSRRWQPTQVPAGICEEAAPLLLEWWNESRRSKHRANATWTEAAWLASIQRVANLPASKQVILAKAGVEHGWQALKPEYLKDELTKPSATGRPMPKDPAMLAALEQWPSQTA